MPTASPEAPTNSNAAELSIKLQQLRRLRSQSQQPTLSSHLTAALQVAKREEPTAKPEVSYIFIGIELPTTAKQRSVS